MQKIMVASLFVFHLLFFFGVSVAAPKADNELLPDISLNVPENRAHAQYLGLKGQAGTPFKLSEIDADVLIIELFNMYCPTCQRTAPKVNDLYKMTQERKQPGKNIVIIGIGTTNTEFEVDTFRKSFDIAFPLFADKDVSVYQALAGEGTPTFVGCKKERNGNHLIFYRKSGGFKKASEFLDEILNRAVLE